MPSNRRSLLAASGNAGDALYIEDVFSTWLYTGNGSTQTITNGIDLDGEGGLVWEKPRTATADHFLWDSSRGTNHLNTNNTDAQFDNTIYAPTFNSDGYTSNYGWSSVQSLVSWTFRQAPKFFDVQTFTTTYNDSPNVISHDLGAELGCAIFKSTDNTSQGVNWIVYHRSLGTGKYLRLNTTASEITDAQSFTAVDNTAGTISFGYPMSDADSRLVVGNAATSNWVGYFFAHEAGGFGTGGDEDVISCGSYTGDGAAGGQQITLGWEPQWVLFKSSSASGNWNIYDTMRGWIVGGNDQYLFPNTTNAESDLENGSPNATGMLMVGNNSNNSGTTYIYIAIRRPMKVPESGTEVYNAIARAGTDATATVTGVGFAPDLLHAQARQSGYNTAFIDRLRGPANYLRTQLANAEAADATAVTAFTHDGMTVGADAVALVNDMGGGITYINHFFRRAPGFMDIVCYTGTTGAITLSHNLKAAPELVIFKTRSGAGAWVVCCEFTSTHMSRLYLDQTNARTNATYAAYGAGMISSQPTAASIPIAAAAGEINTNGVTEVAYLFATLAGVSKVGSYTGTAAAQTIDCGFTAGARFILIKRTDSTGDWYVWDTVRGIIAGNDPYLLLNSTAAEVTSTDYIDTAATGFEISSTAPAAINASGGTFIYLAIA